MAGSNQNLYSARDDMRKSCALGVACILLVLAFGHIYGIAFERWEQARRERAADTSSQVTAEPMPTGAGSVEGDLEDVMTEDDAVTEDGVTATDDDERPDGDEDPPSSQEAYEPDLRNVRAGDSLKVSGVTFSFDDDLTVDATALGACVEDVSDKLGHDLDTLYVRGVVTMTDMLQYRLETNEGERAILKSSPLDGTIEVVIPTDEQWKTAYQGNAV